MKIFKSRNKKKEELLANYFKIKKGTFYFNSIRQYFLKSDKTAAFQVISDKTYQDLDLDEVFMFIDRTTSNVGQQLLYSMFRTIPESKKRIDKLESITKFYKEHPKLKEAVLIQLSRLNSHEAYYLASLFQEDHIPKPKWFWCIQLLSLISVSSLLLSFFFPQFLILLFCILAINYGFHLWNKYNLFQYLGSIPQLLILNQVAKEILSSKVPLESEQELTKCIKTLDSLGKRMRLFKLDAKLAGDPFGLEYAWDIVKALFLIEPLILFNILRELDSKRDQIHEVYKLVGEIDAAISITSLRDSLPYYAFPSITTKMKYISGKDIYHPLLPEAVANTIELDGKSALLTGSNMSGKTTFIRTIGINAIVSQTLNTCFAKEFVMPQLQVHSAIRISDDLMSDKSYYFEEVLTIKNMLDESRSGGQNLFLLDELFKGTNTVERIAAGKSVLKYLSNEDNIVFISTHDLELADYLEGSYNLYHSQSLLRMKAFYSIIK